MASLTRKDRWVLFWILLLLLAFMGTVCLAVGLFSFMQIQTRVCTVTDVEPVRNSTGWQYTVHYAQGAMHCTKTQHWSPQESQLPTPDDTTSTQVTRPPVLDAVICYVTAVTDTECTVRMENKNVLSTVLVIVGIVADCVAVLVGLYRVAFCSASHPLEANF